MTDNHGYETPQKGATEWHKSLNRNFRYIDRDIEIRDIDAAKTDYRPKSGAKFLATDTEDVYVGDGSQWLRLATSGENPSFDTVSAKTLVDRESGNSYSVDQLAGGSGSGGVKPSVDALVTLEGGTPTAHRANGSQIAQDSDAGSVIQSASDDAGVGGKIVIGPGTFQCDTAVALHESQWVEGAGMFQTTLFANSDTGGAMFSSQENDGSGRDERVRVAELTIDMNNVGQSAIFFFIAQECIVERVNAINAGSRSGASNGGILLKNSSSTAGFDNYVLNCRAENCSNVSLDCSTGGPEPARSIVYGNKIFNPDGNQAFTHGIAVENNHHCVVANNTCVENDGNGPRWSPALNINDVSYGTITGNTVKNVVRGLNTANGKSVNTVYANNTFVDYHDIGILFQPNGAPTIEDNLVISNTFGTPNTNGQAIKIDSGSHANVIGNQFRNHSLPEVVLGGSGGLEKPCYVDYNYFLKKQDGIVVNQNAPPVNTKLDSWMSFCGNRIERGSSASNLGVPIVRLNAKYGMVSNNYIGYKDKNNVHEGLKINNGTYWHVTNNVVRGGDAGHSNPTLWADIGDGLIANNVVENDGINLQSGSEAIIRNNSVLDADYPIYFGGNDSGFNVGQARGATYTGDGTSGRFIQTASRPEHVIVKGGDGTLYDVHAQFGTGFEYTAPAGELSITDGGFTVGNDGGDAHPNTSGKTYAFYAR